MLNGEKRAIGEAVRTEDAGECLSADLKGETFRGRGSCLSNSVTGDGEKCAERCGLVDVVLPRPLAPAPLGTSRLDERW